MKNILVALFVITSFSAFAQNEIKFTEEKSIELSKVLAKTNAFNAYGLKTHLIKTFVLNDDLGFSKEEEPSGQKQSLYISVTEFGKTLTTKLYKTESLTNLEVVEVVETEDGFEIKVYQKLNEEIYDSYIRIKTPKSTTK